MNFEEDDYIFINEFVFLDVSRKELKGSYSPRKHEKFLDSLGLQFFNYKIQEEKYSYKFKIIDKQKWFLAKIKYGF